MIRKVIFSVLLLSFLQIVSYLTISGLMFTPDILDGFVSSSNKLDILYVESRFYRDCGNDLNKYYSVNVGKKEPEFRSKLNVDAVKFISTNDVDYKVTSHQAKNYYSIFAETTPRTFFSRNLHEAFHQEGYSQIRTTKYVWILCKWFKVETEKSHWTR